MEHSQPDRQGEPSSLKRALLEHTFSQIIHQLEEGIAVCDPDGVVLYANPSWATLHGYRTTDELTGRQMTICHPKQAWQSAMRPMLREAAKGKTRLKRVERIRKDGSTFISETTVQRLSLEGDPPAGLLVTCRDITDCVRMEQAQQEMEALRDSAALLTSTLDLNEVLDRILENIERVVPHDAANVMLIEGGTARVVRFKGYPPERHKPLAELCFSVSETPNLRHMVETGRPMSIPDVRTYSGWILFANGYWQYSYAAAPIMLEGEVIGFLNVDSLTPGFFNTSHAERLQAFADQAAIAIRNARLYETARRYTAELEQSNKELDAFSHTVAHDLKAPLQVVVGYTNLLRTDFAEVVPPDIQTYLATIEAYAFKMRDIIENILTLSKLSRAEVQPETVLMWDVIESVRQQFRERLEERGFVFETASELPAVLGFRPWLEHVFANLIDNAIKYIGDENPAPRIMIRGIRQGKQVRYEIEDNGTGIAPEDQPRVFEMFARFHREAVGGSGLGLSIVQRIITKLNGEVGVISTPGQGSTFWFTLPAP
jgi:PAS domain S-box-containing protein